MDVRSVYSLCSEDTCNSNKWIVAVRIHALYTTKTCSSVVARRENSVGSSVIYSDLGFVHGYKNALHLRYEVRSLSCHSIVQ